MRTPARIPTGNMRADRADDELRQSILELQKKVQELEGAAEEESVENRFCYGNPFGLVAGTAGNTPMIAFRFVPGVSDVYARIDRLRVQMTVDVAFAAAAVFGCYFQLAKDWTVEDIGGTLRVADPSDPSRGYSLRGSTTLRTLAAAGTRTLETIQRQDTQIWAPAVVGTTVVLEWAPEPGKEIILGNQQGLVVFNAQAIPGGASAVRVDWNLEWAEVEA